MLLTFQFRDNLVGLFRHLFVNVLAQFVILINMLGLLESFRQIFFYQQINTFLAALHSARSIDARAYFEDNVAHRDLSSVEAANVNDRFKADAWVLVQLL